MSGKIVLLFNCCIWFFAHEGQLLMDWVNWKSESQWPIWVVISASLLLSTSHRQKNCHWICTGQFRFLHRCCGAIVNANDAPESIETWDRRRAVRRWWSGYGWLVGQTSQNSNHIISHLIRFHPTTGGAISSRWYYHSHWRTVPCNSNPWHNFNINGIFWPLTVQPSFGQAINCLNKDSSIKMTNLLGNDVWREWVEGRGIDKWGVGSWSASFYGKLTFNVSSLTCGA